jgi:hypothetical protein
MSQDPMLRTPRSRAALAVLATLALLSACGRAAPPSTTPPPRTSPAAPAAPSQLTAAAVVQPEGALARGDTVRADLRALEARAYDVAYQGLDAASQGGGFQPERLVPAILESVRVPAYQGREKAGELPAGALGPRSGEGRVTAANLNVRRCRGTTCAAVGKLDLGTTIGVDSLNNGWYRVVEEGRTLGYVAAQYVMLPEAYRAVNFAVVRAATQRYFENALALVKDPADGVLFTSQKVVWNDSGIHFQFMSPAHGRAAQATVCQTAKNITLFVSYLLRSMNITGPRSIAVWYDGPDKAMANAPLAQVNRQGEVECRGS